MAFTGTSWRGQLCRGGGSASDPALNNASLCVARRWRYPKLKRRNKWLEPRAPLAAGTLHEGESVLQIGISGPSARSSVLRRRRRRPSQRVGALPPSGRLVESVPARRWPRWRRSRIAMVIFTRTTKYSKRLHANAVARALALALSRQSRLGAADSKRLGREFRASLASRAISELCAR